MTTLRDALLVEQSKRQTFMITTFVRTNEAGFDELVRLLLADEYRVTQRAAGILGSAGKLKPRFLQKHLKDLILNLQNDIPVAVKRNTLRVLQYVDIPEELQGVLTEVCFSFLISSDEPIAVKVFSMTVLGNICKKHPELAHELKLTIESQLPFASAGFLSRAKKVLKKLKLD